MTFQAGVFCFRGNAISDDEAAGILGRTRVPGSGEAADYRQPGLLMAQSSRLPDAASPPHVSTAGAITFDGRLDNRQDLRRRLAHIAGNSSPDAALALAVYQKWGIEGFVHLIGDWSLAIWDAGRRSIVLASDYAGVRPLYYCLQGERVLWSSRLGLLAGWVNETEIDDQYVAGLLSFAGCANRTPYRGILPVPPGCSLEVGGNRTEIQRFWRPPAATVVRLKNQSEYEEQFRSHFREAVRTRLAGHRAVLCDLSGGLDSSSIVCMSHELMRTGELDPSRLVTFTRVRPDSLDEPFYTAVEKHCGFESIHVNADAHHFLTATDTGGARPAFHEPLHRKIAAVCNEVGASVYCTGEAGDLIMGNWWDDSDQVAGLLRQGRIATAARDALAWSKLLRIPIYWVLWKAIQLNIRSTVSPAEYSRYDGSYRQVSNEDSLTPDFRKRSGMCNVESFFSQDWMHAPPERRRHFRALSHTLDGRRLATPEPLQDLSCTHPYSHRPLVEFMLSIPADVVCGPGEPRRLMRRALRELWPPELRRRRSKDSFSGVFLSSLRPLAEQLLKEPRLEVVERGYVDAISLKNRLDKLSHSLECNESQLRQIILMEFWLRNREARRRSEMPSASVSA